MDVLALTWPKMNSSTTLKMMWSLLKIVGKHKNDFHLGKHWENATENVGEEPNHKNITKTKFPDSRKWRTTVHVRKKYTTNTKSWISHTTTSQPLEGAPTWVNVNDKNAQEPNREGETYHRKNHGGETTSKLPYMRQKWRTWMYIPMACIFGCLLAPKVKIDLPQKWVFPKFKYLSHTPPIPMQ